MAHSVNSRASSPANGLRDALNEAEDRLVSPTKDQVEALLLQFDEIEQLFDTLDSTDLDLRAEQVRWESLQNRLLSKPTLIANAARGLGGLPNLRAQNPPAESFWWHLDETIKERRNKSLRRLLITSSTVIGVLLLIYGVMTVFFPPSPEALVVLHATNGIEEELLNGDWAAARQTIEQALVAAPNESELWLWDSVLSEQLDDEERAQSSQQRARELLDTELLLLIGVANTRIRIGDLDGAEAATTKALTLEPESALATFILANIMEARGDTREAIVLFEQASDFATTADNAQLAVISRMRMGTLMQAMPALPNSEPDAPSQTP